MSFSTEEHATGNPGSSRYSETFRNVKNKHKHVPCPESPKSHAAGVQLEWSQDVRGESMRRVRAYAETPPTDIQHGGIQGTWRNLRDCDSWDTLSPGSELQEDSFSAVLPSWETSNINIKWRCKASQYRLLNPVVSLFSPVSWKRKNTTASRILTLIHGYGFRSSLLNLCDLARLDKINCHKTWRGLG